MKVIKTQKGYFYKEYKNGKKKRISKKEYLKFKKRKTQKGGDLIPVTKKNLTPPVPIYLNKKANKYHRFSEIQTDENGVNYAITRNMFSKVTGKYPLTKLFKDENFPNKIIYIQNNTSSASLNRSADESASQLPGPTINSNTDDDSDNNILGADPKVLVSAPQVPVVTNSIVNQRNVTNYKNVRSQSNPRKYSENQTIDPDTTPYVYFATFLNLEGNEISDSSLRSNVGVFNKLFSELVKYIMNWNNNSLISIFSEHITTLTELSARLEAYNRNIFQYNRRLTTCTLLNTYNYVFNESQRVLFIEKPDGDSLLASISMGGIILNPANAIKYGGGARSNKEHMAYEENLCYQSNLLESLEVIYKDVCQIFRGINPTKFNNFTDNNYNNLSHRDYFSGYLPTVEACAITFNEFSYIKLRRGVFRKLKTPYLRMVLSIASPDMKVNNPKVNEYINYCIKMIQYWKLVINSTIEMYNHLGLPNPCVVAVMPGDFIKHHSGMYYKPRIELAIAASEALRIAISQTEGCRIIFARKTRETEICKEILDLPEEKTIRTRDRYKDKMSQTDHTKLECVKILKPTELFQFEHQLDCPVIGYYGYKRNNETTTFKSLAKAHPHTLFVFNDHIQGGGYRGQADIRGFRNAIGIPVGLYKDDKTFTLCKDNGNNVNRNFNLSTLDQNTHVNYKAEPTGEFYFNIPFSQAVGLALHYLVLKFRGEYDKEDYERGFKFDRIVFGCESNGSLGVHHFSNHGNDKLLVYVRKQLDTLSSIPIIVTQEI